MKKSIKSLSPHKTGLTVSLVLAISSLFFFLPITLMMLMSSSVGVTDGDGNPVSSVHAIGFMIAMPFLYFTIGYIFTAIGAWVYNQVSKFTGGIQYTTDEIDNS